MALTKLSRTGLYGMLLGAAALFASAAFVPATAHASEYSLNLGSFGVSGKPWHDTRTTLQAEFLRPEADGPVKHYLWGQRPDSVNSISAFHTAPAPEPGVKAAFTDAYSFTLGRAGSLSLSLKKTTFSTVDFADSALRLELVGPNGLKKAFDLSTKEAFSTLWANLEAGNYVLNISGAYEQNGKAPAPGYYVSYVSSLSFGDPVPGDVPLPGALVLLGTALAGAGVTARRKAKAAKADA